MHGTYNHGPVPTLFEDKILVHWGHHSRDEESCGSRSLAKVGTFVDAERTAIDWGGAETVVELVPQAVPVKLRQWHYNPDIIDGVGASGVPRLINGRLYVVSGLDITHGFTNNFGVRVRAPGQTVPVEDWREALDGATPAERRNREDGLWTDVYWSMNGSYVQRWKLDERRVTLVPDSPLYKMSEPVQSLEVTPGRVKLIAPLLPPYANAEPFAHAPAQMQEDLASRASTKPRHRSYAPGTIHLAADGYNGLAHFTQFQRPDGKWVALRDNLLRMGHYYAAVKDRPEDFYPPAVPTNLQGSAMPVAGELPNGWVWVVCNKRKRYEMFLVLSRDGVVFDRTWSVLTIEGEPEPDSIGKAGGPQYFHAVTVGDNIWIVYSITKIQIGATRIPIRSLLAAYDGTGT